MARMSDLIGHQLRWVQPTAFKEEYELQAGDYVAGRLHFPSSFKSFATATNIEGSWTFDRLGFWQKKAVIHAQSGTEEIASFDTNFWKIGGLLNLPNGKSYTLTGNFWVTNFQWLNEPAQPLISYTKIGGVFHNSCDLEIHPLARDLPELAWLVSFGWYMILMIKRDSAAAAAAT